MPSSATRFTWDWNRPFAATVTACDRRGAEANHRDALPEILHGLQIFLECLQNNLHGM